MKTVEEASAGISISMLRHYMNDLREYYAGDEGRFSRMVIDGGKSIKTASPQGWADHVLRVSQQCNGLYAEEIEAALAQLIEWGLLAPQ